MVLNLDIMSLLPIDIIYQICLYTGKFSIKLNNNVKLVDNINIDNIDIYQNPIQFEYVFGQPCTLTFFKVQPCTLTFFKVKYRRFTNFILY